MMFVLWLWRRRVIAVGNTHQSIREASGSGELGVVELLSNAKERKKDLYTIVAAFSFFVNLRSLQNKFLKSYLFKRHLSGSVG